MSEMGKIWDMTTNLTPILSEQIQRNKVRLGHLVRERRIELGLRQKDFRDQGGPSGPTMFRIESGKLSDKPHQQMLERLDMCLRWQMGSCRSILDGGEPIPSTIRSQVQEARKAREVGQVTSADWIAVPTLRINDLLIILSRLANQAVLEGAGEEVIRDAQTARLIAVDLIAIAIATERGDAPTRKLVEKMEAESRGITRTIRTTHEE